MGSKWARPKLIELREKYGGCCQHCGSKDDLNFAHIKPTGLSGKGRGMDARCRDIMKNPRSYILLCFNCHKEFDKLNNNRTTPKKWAGVSRKNCSENKCSILKL